MKTQKSGVYGCILGQAIGDAMGSQTEFHNSPGRPSNVSDLGPTWGYPYPAWSDDTQNMLAIAETILALPPRPNIDVFMNKLGRNFILWTQGTHPNWGHNNRSPGGTCMGAVRSFAGMTSNNQITSIPAWKLSGITNGGKGNGSAMRSSVIGAAYWKDPMYAFRLGCLSSVITHNNLEANMAAGGVTYLCALAINNIPFAIAVGRLLEVFAQWKTTVPTDALAVATTDQDPFFVIGRVAAAFAYAVGKADFSSFQSWNGNDGKGLEALAGSIFYNVRACRYSQVIINASNYAKDSDTVAAIAGAMAGARWGIDLIPANWRQRVEQSEYLHNIAKEIHEFSETVEGK